MPELPEVETWRRLADRAAVGKTIRAAEAADDRKIFDRNDPEELASALVGQTVIATHRAGKHCWLELSGGEDLYLHFGMTGSLWHLREQDSRPSHAKLQLKLDDGTELLYRNMRRIGHVRLLPDARAVPPVSKLGPDPLEDGLKLNLLREQLAPRKAAIKAALLDQSLFAGVGNWIADEVLYQARIDPRTRCCELSSEQIQTLLRRLRSILRKAVEVEADSARFPATWLFHYRWGKKALHDHKGQPVRFDTIGGRTTAWVPARQRNPDIQ